MFKINGVLSQYYQHMERKLRIAIIAMTDNLKIALTEYSQTRSIIPCDYIILQPNDGLLNSYLNLVELAAYNYSAIITVGTCFGYNESTGDIVEPHRYFSDSHNYSNIDPYSLYNDEAVHGLHITSASPDVRSMCDISKLQNGHYDSELYKIAFTCKYLNLLHRTVLLVTNCYNATDTDNIVKTKINDIIEHINIAYIDIERLFNI